VSRSLGKSTSTTRWCRASNRRAMTISLSDVVVTVRALPDAVMVPLLPLQLLQIVVQPVVALLPEPAVLLRPLGGLLQWRRPEPGGPLLTVPAAGDQPRPLQDFEVLGDGGLAHPE